MTLSERMIECLPLTFLCMIVCFVLALPAIVRFRDEWDRRVLMLALSGHFLGAIAQTLYHTVLSAGGDANNYMRSGVAYARLLRLNFFGYGPDILTLILQLDEVRLPGIIASSGSSTTSMMATTGVLLYFIPGDLATISVFFATWAFIGLSCIYRVACETLPEIPKKKIAIAALGVPSVVFWSSTITKESVALGGLGLLTIGAHRILGGKILVGAVAAAIGGAAVILIKPYVLLAFAAGVSAWTYVHRFRTNRPGEDIVLKPFQLLLGLVAGMSIAFGVGMIAPRFKVENLDAEIAQLQAASMGAGGSAFALGMGDEMSFGGQMLFAPLAFITATLRPFIFEAHNAAALVNGIEMSWILYMLIQAVGRRRVVDIYRAILREPFFAFGAVFIVVLGVGVGLGTTNLGTLSRYRMPMMPFWVLLLTVFAHRAARRPVPMIAVPRARTRRATAVALPEVTAPSSQVEA